MTVLDTYLSACMEKSDMQGFADHFNYSSHQEESKHGLFKGISFLQCVYYFL